MAATILAENAGEINLSAITPTALWEYKLPGTVGWVGSGTFGNILLQEMTGSRYSIWYHTFQLHRRDNLTLLEDQPQLRLCFILKNSFLYYLPGQGEMPMHERSYNIIYPGGEQMQLRLQREKPYTSFEVLLTPEQVMPLTVYYPQLGRLLQRVENKQQGLLNEAGPVANPAMMTIIHEILNNTYTGELRKIYLDGKVQELLILALEGSVGKPRATSVKLSSSDVELLYETKALLLKQLEKTYSLEQLAKKTGLTSYKLKNGFMKVFGVGLFNFLLEMRMERAGSLLAETNIPIEHIARMTGYKNLASFSVAFKKYYGYPPRYFRGSNVAV